MKRKLLAVFVAFLSFGAVAQVQDKGGPISWRGKLQEHVVIPQHTMPGFDMEARKIEDSIRDLTNFRRSVPGCIKAPDCESGRIFTIFRIFRERYGFHSFALFCVEENPWLETHRSKLRKLVDFVILLVMLAANFAKVVI